MNEEPLHWSERAKLAGQPPLSPPPARKPQIPRRSRKKWVVTSVGVVLLVAVVVVLALVALPEPAATTLSTAPHVSMPSTTMATVIAGAGSEEARPAAAAAEALFQKMQQLEQSFDPAVAQLYADDALIVNERFYPTGDVRELRIPATEYKALIVSTMPLAKARGDISTYSNITYEELVDGRVRINCTRYSELKKYESPYTLVVENRGDAGWLIVEELSESRP
jgi:hypothetical protein